ncbi:hypothetical protein MO867_09690 [Microbulbifer sp. OS29]|uniref:Lipoprotein n=1 Tax=Microbulbifer okhotskensis TaxID=2926617 RepID=A0A9X2ENW5_9GAMM|nr:hypothetical protein [Microbulbifer okhotskensis]MCO1334610.1 hypothetical protein [Microbulbifer okhotskensis]
MLKKIISIVFCVSLAACANQNVTQSDSECGLEQLMLGVSCIEPDLDEIVKHPLGSPGNPVRADGPAGQREYLSRLVCTNGEPVSEFKRTSSAGMGPWGFILDSYVVLCDTHQGVIEHNVYLDLYHKGYRETEVAEGFGDIML